MCLFLGYSTSHKGYKYLSPSGKLFISKDVIFNESRFPYTELFESSTISPSTSLVSLNPIPIVVPSQVSSPINPINPVASVEASPITSVEPNSVASVDDQSSPSVESQHPPSLPLSTPVSTDLPPSSTTAPSTVCSAPTAETSPQTSETTSPPRTVNARPMPSIT